MKNVDNVEIYAVDEVEVVPKSKSFKTKALELCMSAILAADALAVNAFAEETTSSSSIDYSSIGSAFKSSFVELVNECINISVSIIPVGLGLYGLGWFVKSIKKMFTKVAG